MAAPAAENQGSRRSGTLLDSAHLCHFEESSRDWRMNCHFLVEPVICDERVGHCDAVGLHGMVRAVVVQSDVAVVKVGDFVLALLRR